MLSRVIGSMGVIFVLVVWVIMCVTAVGLVGQWYQVQNIAQFLADGKAKYGDHNVATQAAWSKWKLENGNSLIVEQEPRFTPSQGRTAFYGETVTAEVRCNYQLSVGMLNLAPITITGKGQAVSSYWEGLYD